MTPVPKVIERYFEAVNAEDWPGLRELWHEDAELDVVGGYHLRGVDEIMAYYPKALANFPVHHDDPYGIHVAADVVTVEIRFVGETRNGVKAVWDAVDIFRIDAGRVRRLRTWYDVREVVDLLREQGPVEERLRRLLARAQLADLRDAEPTIAAPPPRSARVLLAGGHPVSADDWRERVRLWELALEVAGGDPAVAVALPSHDPSFAEAAGRTHRLFSVDPADAERVLDVLTWPETGPVAVNCGRAGGYHVLCDGHVVEIIGGELLVTPLNRAEPLVRFAPGVHAAWLTDRCPCGSELPRLAVVPSPAASTAAEDAGLARAPATTA